MKGKVRRELAQPLRRCRGLLLCVFAVLALACCPFTSSECGPACLNALVVGQHPAGGWDRGLGGVSSRANEVALHLPVPHSVCAGRPAVERPQTAWRGGGVSRANDSSPLSPATNCRLFAAGRTSGELPAADESRLQTQCFYDRARPRETPRPHQQHTQAGPHGPVLSCSGCTYQRSPTPQPQHTQAGPHGSVLSCCGRTPRRRKQHSQEGVDKHVFELLCPACTPQQRPQCDSSHGPRGSELLRSGCTP